MAHPPLPRVKHACLINSTWFKDLLKPNLNKNTVLQQYTRTACSWDRDLLNLNLGQVPEQEQEYLSSKVD